MPRFRSYLPEEPLDVTGCSEKELILHIRRVRRNLHQIRQEIPGVRQRHETLVRQLERHETCLGSMEEELARIKGLTANDK